MRSPSFIAQFPIKKSNTFQPVDVWDLYNSV